MPDSFFTLTPREYQHGPVLGLLQKASARVMPRNPGRPILCCVADGANFEATLKALGIGFQAHDSQPTSFRPDEAVTLQGDPLAKLIVRL